MRTPVGDRRCKEVRRPDRARWLRAPGLYLVQAMDGASWNVEWARVRYRCLARGPCPPACSGDSWPTLSVPSFSATPLRMPSLPQVSAQHCAPRASKSGSIKASFGAAMHGTPGVLERGKHALSMSRMLEPSTQRFSCIASIAYRGPSGRPVKITHRSCSPRARDSGAASVWRASLEAGSGRTARTSSVPPSHRS